jgi:hypothetical protein
VKFRHGHIPEHPRPRALELADAEKNEREAKPQADALTKCHKRAATIPWQRINSGLLLSVWGAVSGAPPRKESTMIKEKQESAIKGVEQKKGTRVARASNRTIKKELKVEKPDPKQSRAARRLDAVKVN